MHSSQRNIKHPDFCVLCGNEFIFMHYQKYCHQCKVCPVMLEEDVKIVPNNYRPNSTDFKFSSIMTVEQNIRDLLNILGVSETQANINRNVEKVLYIHNKNGTRGYRDQCAALVFTEYQLVHKMTSHQFCKKTGIEIKKFNKKFLEYKRNLQESRQKQIQIQLCKRNLKIQDHLLQELEEKQENFIKKQFDFRPQIERQQKSEERCKVTMPTLKKIHEKLLKQDESADQRDEEEQQFREKGKRQATYQKVFRLKSQEEKINYKQQSIEEKFNQVKKQTAQFQRNVTEQEASSRSKEQIKQTLSRLYDKIFYSPYLQAMKSSLFAILLERIYSVNDIWEDENQGCTMKEYFRIPSFIFGVIIAYKYKINQTIYIQAVQEILGLSLKKAWLTNFHKICKKIVLKIEGTEDMTEINSQQNMTCSALNNSSS